MYSHFRSADGSNALKLQAEYKVNRRRRHNPALSLDCSVACPLHARKELWPLKDATRKNPCLI